MYASIHACIYPRERQELHGAGRTRRHIPLPARYARKPGRSYTVVQTRNRALARPLTRGARVVVDEQASAPPRRRAI